MHILGESVEEIAKEKAGIIPENGKIVTDVELSQITSTAEKRNSKLVNPEDINFSDGKLSYGTKEFSIPIKGKFQRKNLEKAIKTVEELERLPESLGDALSELRCPGRMEVMEKNTKIILDGAHNASAIEKLLREYPEKFICVFNATETKNSDKMISLLEQKASKFIFTESDVKWSTEADKLGEKCSTEYEIEKNPVEAIEKARQIEKPVLVTGSLYLIGNIKKKIK
jgi:dihydrofolate synthase/folylpolyglutamate synthase